MRERLSMILLGISLFLSSQTIGQIKYELRLDEDLKTYHVYVMSEQNFPAPQNLISTAQITFKVKTNSDFKFNHLHSNKEAVLWGINGVLRSPSLAPEYTYYSIGLQSLGTGQYSLPQNELVELFAFENSGIENPGIHLINENDIMIQNLKTTKINIGNQINLLGVDAGLKNAYSGINAETGLSVLSLQSVYPNPAVDKLHVKWDNRLAEEPQDLRLQIIDATTGLIVQENNLDSGYGKHETSIELNQVKVSGYLLRLQSKSFSSKAQHIMIMN